MKNNNTNSRLLCACSNCGWDNFCQSSSVCFRAGGLSHCSNGLECYGCFDNQIASFKVTPWFKLQESNVFLLLNLFIVFCLICQCQMPNVDCCNQTNFCNFNMLSTSRLDKGKLNYQANSSNGQIKYFLLLFRHRKLPVARSRFSLIDRMSCHSLPELLVINSLTLNEYNQKADKTKNRF